MKPLRIVFVVLGSILALMGLALLAGGGVLGWALATQRDDAGFFTTSSQRFHTRTAAITTRDIDLGTPGPDDWWADRDIATVRIRGASASSAPIFIGIGRDAAVERYLAGVRHDEVTDVDYDPFRATYRVHNAGGAATATPPIGQRFWVARAAGIGTRSVTWHLKPGRWAVVVMNADGRAPVRADIQLGAKVQYLVPLAVGLGGGGLVLLLIGAALIVGAVVARGHRATGEGAPAPPGAVGVVGAPDAPRVSEPVQLTGHLDPDLSRWQWLVKWFLAIPHFIVLLFLWIAFFVLTVVAFFAILFTGRYPRSIFDFNVGVLRWNWRVQYYATSVLGTDRYPPFSLAPADYPATLDIAYPEELSRGLVLVKWWLLAIPQLLVVGAFTATGSAGWGRGGAAISLLGVLVLIAAVALLFTAKYPRGAVRPRARHPPVDHPRGGLRRADDRPLPAVPARPGPGRARRRCSAAATGADGATAPRSVTSGPSAASTGSPRPRRGSPRSARSGGGWRS